MLRLIVLFKCRFAGEYPFITARIVWSLSSWAIIGTACPKNSDNNCCKGKACFRTASAKLKVSASAVLLQVAPKRRLAHASGHERSPAPPAGNSYQSPAVDRVVVESPPRSLSGQMWSSTPSRSHVPSLP